MVRINDEDMYCLGLLYLYKYSNKTCTMIKKADLDQFVKELEKNLITKEEMTYIDQSIIEEPIYFITNDKQQETYYILKPEVNMKQIEEKFYVLPYEYYQALQKSNALKPLGLINYNDEITLNTNIQKEHQKDNNILKKVRKITPNH